MTRPDRGRIARHSSSWKTVASGGAALLVLVVGAHLAVAGRALFETEPWEATRVNVGFTLATAGAVAITLAGVRMAGSGWQHDGPRRRRRAVILVLVTAAIPVVVVLFSKRVFDSLAREDHPVEMASAAANLLTAGVLAAAARRCRLGVRVAMLAGALAFFFVGMEEVSWFQRVFDYGTPRELAANEQGEANIHNFATEAFQSLYYFTATALMIVFPYAAACAGRRWPSSVKALVPGSLPVTLAVVALPYSYATSSYLASHLSFWATVAALCMWPSGLIRDTRAPMVLYALVVQAVMFAVGAELPRPWAPSEYREMFIGLGFLSWSIHLNRRFRLTLATARDPLVRPAS